MQAIKRFLTWLFSSAPFDVPDVSGMASRRVTPARGVEEGWYA